jgi:hypothetical protein
MRTLMFSGVVGEAFTSAASSRAAASVRSTGGRAGEWALAARHATDRRVNAAARIVEGDDLEFVSKENRWLCAETRVFALE